MAIRIKEKAKSGNSYTIENVPDETWIPFRQLVFLKDTTIKSVIAELIEKWVEEHRDELREMVERFSGEKGEDQLPNTDSNEEREDQVDHSIQQSE